MSIQSSTASGLPVVNQALEPASIRHGSAATQKAYQSALAFEEVLVEQLSKSLTATIGGGEDGQEAGAPGEAGESASSGELSSMLPQALSAGIMNAGGLGLAAQMTQNLEGVSAGAHASAGEDAAAGAGAAPGPSTIATAVGGTAAPGTAGATGGTLA